MARPEKIEALRLALKAEREQKAMDDEEKRLSKELFELRNRELIGRRKARSENTKRIVANVGKFFKGSGRKIGKVARDMDRARSPKSSSRRMREVHGSDSLFGNSGLTARGQGDFSII